MKLCIVGKYPPIEGGVSAHTYWLARGLAQRGHDIHVVTNADEVEDIYRLKLQFGDDAWYQPRFEKGGGRVCVYNAEPFSSQTMSHIPIANPFVTKLASLATDIIRRHQCEAILAYYYEPYCVAAHLASNWTNCPLIVKHAGSDLDRLLRVPDLATTYKEVLRSADAVVTQLGLIPRFLGMGVDSRRLEPDIPDSIATDVFNPEVEPLDIASEAFCSVSAGDFARLKSSKSRIPVIGAYGKTGTYKGTYDLIEALGALAYEGLDFRFAAMIGRAQGKTIAPAIRQAGLAERTYILPMLPNWRVPSFLRACTAICYLERDFPVAIHRPIIPREVIACGTCLVLSNEIALKQAYSKTFLPGRNALIVRDPKDRAELAAALRGVLIDPAWALSIGEQGLDISRTIEDYDSYIIGWERLFARHIGNATPTSVSKVLTRNGSTVDGGFERIIPDLVAYFRRTCASVVDSFLATPLDCVPFEAAIEFCQFVAERADTRTFGVQLPKVLATLAYAKARLDASREPLNGNSYAFVAKDRLHGKPVSRESAWLFYPIRSNFVQILPFDYDVSGLGLLASVGGYQSTGENHPDFAVINKTSMLVLFNRTPNLVRCEIRINEATRALVNQCDGARTTGQLLETMCTYFGAETAALRAEVADNVFSALDSLYRSNVIAFCELKPRGGWVGGQQRALYSPGSL